MKIPCTLKQGEKEKGLDTLQALKSIELFAGQNQGSKLLSKPNTNQRR